MWAVSLALLRLGAKRSTDLAGPWSCKHRSLNSCTKSGVCLSIGLLVEGFGHIIYNIIYYNMIKAWGLRQGFDQD